MKEQMFRDVLEYRPDIFISRIIALPGDSIVIENNIPVINGKTCPSELVRKTKVPYMVDGEHYYDMYYNEYSEMLPNGKVLYLYKLDYGYLASWDTVQVVKLKKDEYYVMGDSRSNSFDSRFHGPVRRKNITGKIINFSK